MACVLNHTRPVHNFAPYVFKIHFSITLASMLMFPKVPVSFGVSDQNKFQFVISSSVVCGVKCLGSMPAELLTSRATEPASEEGLWTVELFCATLHLRNGDKKESFAICINLGIRRSEIIKRNLIDSGLYVHERARCSHGKPDRRKRKCCRESHMHVGTGSGYLPTDTVTETGWRVVFASRNKGTRQGSVQSSSRE